MRVVQRQLLRDVTVHPGHVIEPVQAAGHARLVGHHRHGKAGR